MSRLFVALLALPTFGCSQDATKAAETAQQQPQPKIENPNTGLVGQEGQRRPRARDASVFKIRPYVQIGAKPAPSRMSLCWVDDGMGQMTVECDGTANLQHYPLPAGGEFWEATLTFSQTVASQPYTIKRNGTTVWTSETKSLVPPDKPAKIVVFGDCGADSKPQSLVAKLTDQQVPDMVLITGDIVYKQGKPSEYATNFWPFYNGEQGALLMERIPFIGAAGNHDIYAAGAKDGDGLGYFQYWSLPMNGPTLKPNGRNVVPTNIAAGEFQKATGGRYPVMANGSFDEGPVHITYLDSNTYTHWDDPELIKWLENDLNSTKQPWKVVIFHHPPFHTSDKHQMDRMMRTTAATFEKCGVNLVLAGHVHNYQRTKPLQYLGNDTFKFDDNFDGMKVKRTKLPIYLVEGAGGQGLYDVNLEETPSKWQPFMVKYKGSFGLGVFEATKDKLDYRHLGSNGEEQDHFILSK